MVEDIAFVVVIVYTTIFDGITVTKDLNGSNSLVDYKSLPDYANLVIQKVTVEVMIGFFTEGFAA